MWMAVRTMPGEYAVCDLRIHVTTEVADNEQ